MKKKKWYVVAACCLFGVAGCMNINYQCSTMKIGFTTQNFIPAIPVSADTAKDFLRYARKNGYSWIELRDPDASLTVEECKDIARLASELGIEVNYSAQRGLLAEDFWEVFGRAVVNTAVFEGPRLVRALALRGNGEKGWDEDELTQMITVANEAVQQAAEYGVRLTVENADAALYGDGESYYGMNDLLEKVDRTATLQLDTANLFTGPVPVSPDEAEAFVERFAARISYLHLKSARDGKALPVIDGNPLSFETIFSLLETTGKPVYAAIELASGNASAEEIYQNMNASLINLNKQPKN